VGNALIRLAVGVLLATVLGAVSAAGPAVRAQTAITATTTLGVFADFARQVGGDRVEVIQLLGDGVDPHDYQMTPSDLVAVNRSQLLIYNGYNLEPFLGQLVTGGGRPGLTLVQLAEGLTPITDGRTPNPHFWLNPQYAARYVQNLRDAYVAADPAGADTYRANAERYLGELAALDAELETTLSVVPTQSRKLIAAHDALPYFARHYGFELIGAVLSSEAQEPSPSALIALIRQTRQAGVRAVFTEPQLNPRLIQQVARETGIQIVPTYSDSFPPDSSIRTYAEMMRVNARNIADALR
jgi:ABC-type Zn uptake system ZnuABC Zn-binding protein ZnuA